MQVGTGQGPYLRSLELLGKSSVTTKSKNKKNVTCDRPTNATTDGETSVTRDKKTRPDTRPISSRWRVGRGSTLRGRGSQSVGRGCILGGQGLLCSEITNTVNFAASEISRDGHSDRPTKGHTLL